MAYQLQEEVAVQPVQSGHIHSDSFQPAIVHKPSPNFKGQWATAWARSTQMLARQTGREQLNFSRPTQMPWSGDYRRYSQVKIELSKSAQPALTRDPDLAVEQPAAPPISKKRLDKTEKTSRPFVCLLCGAGMTKLRGVERHFMKFHPPLSEDQYVSCFIDERNPPPMYLPSKK